MVDNHLSQLAINQRTPAKLFIPYIEKTIWEGNSSAPSTVLLKEATDIAALGHSHGNCFSSNTKYNLGL